MHRDRVSRERVDGQEVQRRLLVHAQFFFHDEPGITALDLHRAGAVPHVGEKWMLSL